MLIQGFFCLVNFDYLCKIVIHTFNQIKTRNQNEN